MDNYDIAIMGCGFVGSSLAAYLNNNFKVKTFDIKPQPVWIRKYKIQHEICDIRNYTKLSKKIGNPSIVINTAIIQIPQINEVRELAYQVNVIGTQNLCKVVEKNPNILGFILAGSWHVFGEQNLNGYLDEKFGYRPDMVEDRARLYTISKILQECITRFYDEKTQGKIFGIIRMGTVLGENMPKETAASLFIMKALNGEPITPYKHSMYRPMFYVDINDICKAFEAYVKIILKQKKDQNNSFQHIVNVAYPKAINIFDLATIVKKSVIKNSGGKIRPKIVVVDKGLPLSYTPRAKYKIKLNISKLKKFLRINKLKDPKKVIDELVKVMWNKKF